MTIHLSKDLENLVHDAVRDGLYAREDDVIRGLLDHPASATASVVARKAFKVYLN
jgi:Arc/MetJ-type ribon-helix-helix transcriptional regulator